MILIISRDEDISTDNFMEWCHYFGKPVLRINQEESIGIVNNIILSDKCDVSFNIKGKTILLDEIDAVWFRRGDISNASPAQFIEFSNLENCESIREYFNNEARTLDDFVLYTLKQKKSLNHPRHYNANKLIVLKTALKIGLPVPETVITTHASDVNSYFNNRRVITKSIQDAVTVKNKDYAFSPTTHSGTLSELNIPENFYYSKFQSLIDAKYEIRIFFVGYKYYACAQFLYRQRQPFVEVHHKGSKVVPYMLPNDVLVKLKKLNTDLGYDCGSIDMLVDKNDVHYFLEINPVGQYEFMRNACNFNFNCDILNYFSDERSV